MGRLNLYFPHKLTKEEMHLQKKYELLREMKDAVEQTKAPSKPQKKVEPVKIASKPLNAEDAKERAKKRVLSGEVLIRSKPDGEKVFKKPKLLERKLQLDSNDPQQRPSASY